MQAGCEPQVIEGMELLALPASSAQQRFWVLDQIKPGDPSLNVAVQFVLSGQLNTTALHRAMDEVLRRHEILRSTFCMRDEQVVQLVAPSLLLDIPVSDLRRLPARSRRAEADRIADEEARQPFSLAIGPLLQVRLLRLDDQEHILLITIHHIISDGWSIGVIMDELGLIYEAFCAGKPSPLPALAIQYADYTLWEQENRKEQSWAEAESYWRDHLADLPRFEVMPDRPRVARGKAVGNILSRLLPLELTAQLRELSRRHDVTLFMTMLAALSALLSRYTGEHDIVTGSQVAGRNIPDVEPLIGPFINTLALRNDTSGDPTFSELLGRVREVVSRAIEHQQFPFEKVAEVLRLERRADANLLFQINFIYQRDFVHPWSYAGIQMRPLPSKSPGAMYDLNIFLVERAEGWRFSCEYNTDLYFQSTITRLLEHYERLLSALLVDPDRRLSQYQFLTECEEKQILVDWNRTGTPYARDRSVPQLFEEQVERTPAATAVICGQQSLTYAELNRRSNQLAHRLRAEGIDRGSLVGICLDRSADMLIAALATFKAGAAYVPLDPSFPCDRLSFMARDAGLQVLITEEKLATLIETPAAKVLLDREQKSIGQEEAGNFASGTTPGDLAYVIYTSGSTGTPKGVAVHHGALVNLLSAAIREPGICASDSLLAVTTLSFDIAGLELFGPLLAGARIVLATRAIAADGRELRNLLASSGATVLQATPSTWRMLIDAGWNGTPRLKMLCGGEPLSRELADALLERGGELWNMYGPTETTIWSSWCRIETGKIPITIGRPAANQMFYVLDVLQRPVPVGVPGELYIGGDGVATGYHHRTELTAERFLENPFAAGRIYRTGDRARFRPDGTVEMLGRMDTQVKVRGFRIELGEVESALAACAEVRNAAVALRQDSSGQNLLAGYFVPQKSSPNLAGAIREQLKKRLPDYMIPSFLVELKDMPLTPNGKVDRKALPAPGPSAQERPDRSTDLESPTTDLQRLLIKIWRELLGIENIGLNDDFFDLGGHSLLATRLISRIEKDTGYNIPVATLFEASTVAQLARKLENRTYTHGWAPLVKLHDSQSTDAVNPLFCIHSLGANLVSFHKLTSLLRTNRPVYGLQPHGLDGNQNPLQSVEEIAAAYLQEIRAIQPHGPYYLSGICLGGIIAYEIAQQLHAAGQQVGLLVLIDTFIWSKLQYLHTRSNLLSYLDDHLGELLLLPLSAQVKYLANWIANGGVRLAWAFGWGRDGSLAQASLRVAEANVKAVRAYEPKPYAGKVTQFICSDASHRAYEDRRLAWSNLAEGGFEVHIVPGNHLTMVEEPHVRVAAQKLQLCLDRADGIPTTSANRPNLKPVIQTKGSKDFSRPNPKEQRVAGLSALVPMAKRVTPHAIKAAGSTK